MRAIEQDTQFQLEELYKRLERIKSMHEERREVCDGVLSELAMKRKQIEDAILQLEARQMQFSLGEK